MMSTPSFTCPECGRTTYNPTDIAQGWCNHCKRGDLELDEQRLEKLALAKDRESLREALKGWTPEELAEAGIV